MRNLQILAALGLVATAGLAQAEVTGTAAIVSDYDFRGFSQSGEDPAVQLSIDWANESGWYAGVWGSSVDSFVDPVDGVGSASTEVDLYTGFKGGSEDGLAWDAGIVYYTYAGASNLNYAEIYGKATLSYFTGSLYYTNDYAGNDDYAELYWGPGVDGGAAFYVSLDANIPAGPLTVGLHAGHSDGDGIEGMLGVEDSYQDYSIGVSYTASNLTLGMKWVAYDAGDAGSDDRIVLSVSTALPW